MARFRIRNDARTWFKQIASDFNTDFDQYYFCLMAGFAAQRSNETGATSEFNDDFVQDYKEASRFLIGLLVTAELKTAGIGLGERDAVREMFKRLIDPRSPNQLTDDGMRRMNAYASGGYDFLADSREDKPFTSEEFLRDYAQLIKGVIAGTAEP